MRVLIDTHVLLWWLAEESRLSAPARGVLESGGKEVFFSAASAWEIAIKAALGQIELSLPPRTLLPKVLREQSIRPLDVTLAHALATAELPAHHRDPFDRMLVAQARVEKMAIVTADPAFRRYDVRVIW